MTARPEVVEVETDGVRAEVTAPMTHLCPFRDETDRGTVTLGWYVDGRTLELHSVAEWLRSFAETMITHEDLTRRLWTTLRFDLGLAGVTVSTEWDTAGMRVRVGT